MTIKEVHLPDVGKYLYEYPSNIEGIRGIVSDFPPISQNVISLVEDYVEEVKEKSPQSFQDPLYCFVIYIEATGELEYHMFFADAVDTIKQKMEEQEGKELHLAEIVYIVYNAQEDMKKETSDEQS